MVEPFSEEQARALINLEQRYQVWIEAERALEKLPYDLRRKEVGGRSYLYEIKDRSGNGKSLGPWSDELEAKFTAYRAEKANAKAAQPALKTPGQARSESCAPRKIRKQGILFMGEL